MKNLPLLFVLALSISLNVFVLVRYEQLSESSLGEKELSRAISQLEKRLLQDLEHRMLEASQVAWYADPLVFEARVQAILERVRDGEAAPGQASNEARTYVVSADRVLPSQEQITLDRRYHVEFKDIVAPLSAAKQERFIKVSFSVEGSDAAFQRRIIDAKPQVKNAVLKVLHKLTLKELDRGGVADIVRGRLIEQINKDLGVEGLVENLYFSELVVQ